MRRGFGSWGIWYTNRSRGGLRGDGEERGIRARERERLYMASSFAVVGVNSRFAGSENEEGRSSSNVAKREIVTR